MIVIGEGPAANLLVKRHPPNVWLEAEAAIQQRGTSNRIWDDAVRPANGGD